MAPLTRSQIEEILIEEMAPLTQEVEDLKARVKSLEAEVDSLHTQLLIALPFTANA